MIDVPTHVKVLAVSKTRPIEDIKKTVSSGICDIGENIVQEAEEKYAALKGFFKENKVRFHLIGHLQSSKAKKAVQIFDIIQSVDSIKLAAEIDKRAKEIGKTQKIMLQINIGKEPQKYGMMPEELKDMISQANCLKSLELIGLMCIPPQVENPEESRPYFRRMKGLFDESKLKYLSMGMTNDYKVAIEEGSNMIRIGRGIFEERKY